MVYKQQMNIILYLGQNVMLIFFYLKLHFFAALIFVTGIKLWQAKLTFIHNYRYPQFKLWISTIRIVDIDNSNPRIDMNPNQIISLFMAGKTNIFGANPMASHINIYSQLLIDNSNC